MSRESLQYDTKILQHSFTVSTRAWHLGNQIVDNSQLPKCSWFSFSFIFVLWLSKPKSLLLSRWWLSSYFVFPTLFHSPCLVFFDISCPTMWPALEIEIFQWLVYTAQTGNMYCFPAFVSLAWGRSRHLGRKLTGDILRKDTELETGTTNRLYEMKLNLFIMAS